MHSRKSCEDMKYTSKETHQSCFRKNKFVPTLVQVFKATFPD